MIELSICVPTYSRAGYLRESLNNILSSVKGIEDKIEIIVSDNASTDNTRQLAEKYCKDYNFIHYSRNRLNVFDKNYFIAVNLAKGKYIWLFSDDDKLDVNAVKKVLKFIEMDYNLIICNHSVWDADFSHLLIKRILPFYSDRMFCDHNSLLKSLGLKLGFISSVIFKKDIFNRVTETEFDKYVESGFAFLYSIYKGIRDNCRAYLISEPLVCARGGNSPMGMNEWYQKFAVGSSLVFRSLNRIGYSDYSVYLAERGVLKDYIMHKISFGRRNGEEMNDIFGILMPVYRKHCFFWLVCVPMLFSPTVLLLFVHKAVLLLRRFGKILHR